MKILLLNWQDPLHPQAGGAEVHLLEIFRRLQLEGHEVTWLVSAWNGASPVERLDGMEILRTGSRYTYGLAAPLYYRAQLRDRGFDVIVEALNKVPLYAPLWSPAPHLLIVHHLFGATAFQQAYAPLAAATWLQERPIGLVYRSVPVQAISQSTADDLVDRGLSSASIRVVHPGVDLGFFRPGAGKERAADPTFVYVGRLQRYKRIDLILTAFAELVGEFGGARLIIAGRGDQRESLEKQATVLGIGRNLHFAGFVTEEAKRDLFRTAWANLFVSPKEGWGITNLEAAACGTATIASDSPGLRESVHPEKTGLLVRHGDVEALANAMRRLASNRGLVEELGRGAAAFAETFNWERAARDTLDQLLEATSSGAATARL